EEDLGRGFSPTWSPDGRFVAFQTPGDRGSKRAGDYVIVQADAPHEKALLLSNARGLFSFWGMGYWGAPLWSPDNRYVNVLNVRSEKAHPHLSAVLAVDLRIGAGVALRLDLADDVVHRLCADRPLLARFQNRGAELLAVEVLTPAVSLDDVRQDVLDVLVGRVPPVALEA